MKVICVDYEEEHLNKICNLCETIQEFDDVKGFLHAESAIEHVQENETDLVFLEVNLPTVNGIELASKLKDINPNLVLFFATGSSEYALEAFYTGAFAYLLKPLKRIDIMRGLDRLYSIKKLPFYHRDLFIRTFGRFEAFYENKPIKFKYSKTKDLLAYLIDRNGEDCSVLEINHVLFGESIHAEYLRVLRKDLLDSFSACNKKHAIRSGKGYIGINKKEIECDYYDYLDGKITRKPEEYMSQYKFGEETLAKLMEG